MVTDEHLLQLGAALQEEAALKASADLGVTAPWGAEESLYGSVEGSDRAPAEWEQIVDASRSGLHYRAWRKPLRGGLYMYRSSALIEGVSPQQVRAFHLDDDVRRRWDDTALEIVRFKPAGAPRLSSQSEWCLQRFRCRFPRPMATRVYNYARRVWHRPADGGCYAICRTTKLPTGEGMQRGRTIEVGEYVSAVAIREAEGGTELATVYFESSGVRPGIAKIAVPSGLFPLMVKYETALRENCRQRLPQEGRVQDSLDDCGSSEGPSHLAAAPRGAASGGGIRWPLVELTLPPGWLAMRRGASAAATDVQDR